jgi:hypothetical protein
LTAERFADPAFIQTSLHLDHTRPDRFSRLK